MLPTVMYVCTKQLWDYQGSDTWTGGGGWGGLVTSKQAQSTQLGLDKWAKPMDKKTIMLLKTPPTTRTELMGIFYVSMQ
jgi:hypothetical protein